MKRVAIQCSKAHGGWLVALFVAFAAWSGCTTTERAARMVVDHHIGMVQGAVDIMNGEAEAREQRVAKLQADLERSRAALTAEQDQTQLVELLRQHLVLQDALVAELMQGHGAHGGHRQAKADDPGGEQLGEHQH